MVHVILGRALGGFGDAVGRGALGGDEQHAAAVGDGVRNLREGLMQHRRRLRKVNDVNIVAGTVDEWGHLGVPAMRLVTEVNASFQELTHIEGGNCHWSDILFRLILRDP